MVSTFIIILGLGLDALGALAIGTPDLPRKYRNIVRMSTPRVRAFHKARQEILIIQEQNTRDIEQLESILTDIWPALRKHRDIGEFEECDIGISDDIDRPVEIDSDVREEPFKFKISSLARYTEGYIEDWYRSRGWFFLFIGFLVQLFGYGI